MDGGSFYDWFGVLVRYILMIFGVSDFKVVMEVFVLFVEFGDVIGVWVFDFGCGDVVFVMWLMVRGVWFYLGVDVLFGMVGFVFCMLLDGVQVWLCIIEVFDAELGSVDFVVSWLVLYYVDDFIVVLCCVWCWLVLVGWLFVIVVYFVVMSYDVCFDMGMLCTSWVVDDYFVVGLWL